MTDKFVLYFVRHENRYAHGLADCSLTHDGIYSARHELPKIMNDQPNIQNIYCSPLLRTCQTIYQYAKDNNHLIKLEQSLYEFVNRWTSHYTILAINNGLPQINKDSNDILCLYKHQYSFLLKIKGKFKQSDWTSESKIAKMEILTDLRQDLDNFIIMMNDDHYTYMTKFRFSYDKYITKVMEFVTHCILYIDGLIVGKIPTMNIPNDKNAFNILVDLIDKSLNILESFNITEQIDKSYDSVINISECLMGKNIETLCDSIDRTKLIVDKMMNCSEYQNSMYISHLTTINALIVNVFKNMFQDNISALQSLNEQFNHSFDSFDSFCELNPIDIGSIHKITIDKISTRVIVDQMY